MGDARVLRGVLVGVLGVWAVMGVPSSALADLPQDHTYQVELRDYLGTLSESDFDLTLQDLGYDASYLSDADHVHQHWLVFQDGLPRHSAIRADSQHFLLSNIEQGGDVYMSTGRGGFIDPSIATWWTQWDYAGNPYHDSAPLKRRAFVGSAVDMMMQDADHAAGNNQRSDYLGQNLIRWGWTYQAMKDDLPANVQTAYEDGLVRMFEKVEDWGPTGIFGDMDSFAIVGTHMVAEAIDDDNLRQRARDYTQRVFDRHYKPGGYMAHGDGLDPSYEGITLQFLTWASLAFDDPAIDEVVEDISRLKAHMNFPDADGVSFWGPSHMATATANDMANDQWANYQRDNAAAMLSDEALYLMWGGRRSWLNRFASEAEMRQYIANRVDDFNDSPSSSSPGPWSHDHWISDLGIEQAALYYQPGFYSMLTSLDQANDPLTKPPFLRSEDFIESFDDVMLSARVNNYGVFLHTDRLSNWGNTTTELSGFGGGSISTFWTEDTGPVILGRSGGFQANLPGTDDNWTNWQMWPTHALSGVSGDGKPFSSARQRFPEAEYTVTESGATVVATGSLTGDYPAPNDALTGEVNYSRTFVVADDGLHVTSSITSDGSDTVQALYEILPVFLYGSGQSASQTDVAINLFVDGAWTAATTSLTGGVENIRIDRFDGSVFINFSQRQSVQLAPEVWGTDYQDDMRLRNIMIDLLGSNGQSVAMPEYLAIDYTISPTFTPIPEPGTAALMALAGSALLLRRRRQTRGGDAALSHITAMENHPPGRSV